jgi:hypothetical protein
MKKHLNSVEEVIKELKDEGKIFDGENSDKCYKMVNGIICTIYTNGDINFNTSIFITKDKNRYYTEEQEPLKFEVNKPYKTRENLKVFLNEINEKNGHMHFINADDSYWTNEKGKYDNNEITKADIIGVWVEQK